MDRDEVLKLGKVHKLLNSAETAGAFQLESPAQRNLQSRLQADHIEDIVASVALIRPGPIKGNMVEPFLTRRHGQEPVTYVDPRLEEILKDTYGVVLFQGQVIEIAVKIAGFSPTWHPMEFARPKLAQEGVLTNQQIKEQRPNGPVKAAGLLIRPHRPPTRSGRTVIFFTLEDETGLLDVTAFQNVYEQYGKEIFSSSVLLVEGHLDHRGTASMIAARIEKLN